MPPFRIQYASNLFVDLHKHKFDALVRPVSSSLALLGNIGVPDHAKTYHFLNYCSSNWDSVFWIRGPHELTTTIPTNQLADQFQNVRCLDSNEEVLPLNNTILLGLPSSRCSSLTQSLLRTMFWSVTNPMSNIVFLTNKFTKKSLIPLQGFRLETPSFVWLVGDGTANGLAVDAEGSQFYAVNKCFSNTKLQKVLSYSPTAYLEFTDRGAGQYQMIQKQSLQLA